MSRRKQKLAARIGEFMRQYQRKAQGGRTEPNDRKFSRNLAGKLRRMKPEELDDLLHSEEIQQREPAVAREPRRETMASIEITGWKKNFVGWSAWGAHAKSELKKRLRRGVKGSPDEIRRLAGQIDARQPVSLSSVREEAVCGLVQVLESTGAELRVSTAGKEQLIRRTPKR